MPHRFPVRRAIRAAVVLALASAPLAAQSAPAARPPGGVSGQVIVAPAGTPVAGAEVALLRDGDTTSIARRTTVADGRFAFDTVAEGVYRLRVRHGGHAPHLSDTLRLGGGRPSIALEPIRLVAAMALGGLEVRARRPAVVHAEDRNIYSIRDMPAASGGAADVMRTIPELEVDVDGNVKMVGNRNVTIHINGRPSPLKGEALTQFLQQLPADRIERVEVIPNPSVRFDSSGPIVNVVLRKDVQLGLSGSVSANAATRGGTGPSGQIAYQRGKLTLFGGMSSRFDRNESESKERRQNLRASPVTFLDQDQHWEHRSGYGSGDLTAELEVGPKETVWASASGSLNDRDRDGLSHEMILDAAQVTDEAYDREHLQDFGNRSYDLGAGFRRIVEAQRHELGAELRRSMNGGDRSVHALRETTMRRVDGGSPWTELRLSDADTEETTTTAKLDYSRPIGWGVKVEAGVRTKIDETREVNTMRVFAPRESATPLQNAGYALTYRDTEHSAYVTLTRNFGPFSVQGAARVQRASMMLRPDGEAERFENDRVHVLPSANVSYKFGEGRDVRVAYSKGLWRPFLGWLNPYALHTDTMNLQFGNPHLLPDVIHSFTADLSLRTRLGTFRMSPYVRRVDDESFYIRTVDERGVATGIPHNIASVKSYGGNATLSGKPLSQVTLSATVGGHHQSRDGGALGAEYSGGGGQVFFSANTTVQAGHGWDLQGSVRQSSPYHSIQGDYSSTLWSDVGVKKKLWNDKASVSLRVADPFDIHRFRFEGRNPSFVLTSRSRSSWGSRTASMSFTYRFGKVPTRKSTPNEGRPAGGDAGPGDGPM